MVQALTGSLRGSVTVRGKRGKAGTGIGREGTGTDDGPAAQTGIQTGESVGEATAAAGTERANVEIKKGRAVMTRTGRKTGNIIKTEALTERGPGTERTGEKVVTEGIRMTGRDTETRGKPSGRAGAEVRKGNTKVVVRRRAGKEIAATAEIVREMESSVLTKGVVARIGAIIIESPAVTTVNTVNAEGVRAPSKSHPSNISTSASVFLS